MQVKKCWTKQWCGDECMMLNWGGREGTDSIAGRTLT